MQRALALLPARHDGLRTAIIGETQRIHPSAELTAPFIDFSDTPRAEMLARLAEQERAPFDFTQPPLMRAAIVKLGG